MKDGTEFWAPLAVATATCGLMKGSQTANRRVAGAGIARTVNSHRLAKDHEGGKPEGCLIRCELRKLPARAIAVRVLWLDGIGDSRVKDGALDRNALITHGPRTRIGSLGPPEGVRTRGCLRNHRPGKQCGHEGHDDQLSNIVTACFETHFPLLLESWCCFGSPGRSKNGLK
jgi:hypothetical protein